MTNDKPAKLFTVKFGSCFGIGTAGRHGRFSKAKFINCGTEFVGRELAVGL